MRSTGLWLSAIALMVFAGCSDTDPLSSPAEEDGTAPAGKLTISRRVAGGFRPGLVPFVGVDLTGQTGVEVTIEQPRPCPEGFNTVTATASGTINPMGEVTAEFSQCGDGSTYKQGIFILTDANGDILHGTYNGNVFSFDPTTLNVTFGGSNTTRGGTGPYEGASGRFAHNASGAILADGAIAYKLRYDGRISLPNATQ